VHIITFEKWVVIMDTPSSSIPYEQPLVGV